MILNGDNIYNANSSNVGVGTANPLAKLHVEAIIPGFLDDGFEDNTLAPFTSATSSKWSITSTPSKVNTGTYAASSGPIGSNGTSSMGYTVNIPLGGASLSFAYSVSSENNYDWLRFYIDGVRQNQWSGEQPYSTATYNLASGTRTLRWAYEKDRYTDNGSDAAYIDDVLIVPKISNSALRIVDGTQGSGKVLTSDANGGASWQTITETTSTGPMIHSVKGTEDTSTNSSTFSDMQGMTLTFTPKSSKVYVTFSASGAMDLTDGYGNTARASYTKFILIKTVGGVEKQESGTVSLTTDYYGSYVATAWNASFNMYPISVTPGITTQIKIKWMRGGEYPSYLRCNVKSQADFSHRNLTIYEN